MGEVWSCTPLQCAETRKRLNRETELENPRRTAILLTCSRAFAFCTYVSVASLFKNSPQLAQESDVFVFLWNAPSGMKQIFASISPQVHVLDFDMPYPVPDRKFISKYTPASYARFECFRLLDRYERVLFLDADILVRKELDIFPQVKHGIAMTLDPVVTTVGKNFFPAPAGVNPNATGYNAGVFALTRDLPCPLGTYAALTDWLYGKMAEWADFVYLPDQAVINVAVEHFGWQMTTLSKDYNRPASSSLADLKRAFIVHSTGTRKFWCYYYFHDWYQLYAQWIAKGGEPVSIRKDSPAYLSFCRKHGLQDKVFFQLMPDCFAHPTKALRFALKAWLKAEF